MRHNVFTSLNSRRFFYCKLASDTVRSPRDFARRRAASPDVLQCCCRALVRWPVSRNAPWPILLYCVRFMICTWIFANHPFSRVRLQPGECRSRSQVKGCVTRAFYRLHELLSDAWKGSVIDYLLIHIFLLAHTVRYI